TNSFETHARSAFQRVRVRKTPQNHAKKIEIPHPGRTRAAVRINKCRNRQRNRIYSLQIRPLFAKTRSLFESVGQLKNAEVLFVTADDLHADRQPFWCEAAGNRRGGVASC